MCAANNPCLLLWILLFRRGNENWYLENSRCLHVRGDILWRWYVSHWVNDQDISNHFEWRFTLPIRCGKSWIHWTPTDSSVMQPYTSHLFLFHDSGIGHRNGFLQCQSIIQSHTSPCLRSLRDCRSCQIFNLQRLSLWQVQMHWSMLWVRIRLEERRYIRRRNACMQEGIREQNGNKTKDWNCHATQI